MEIKKTYKVVVLDDHALIMELLKGSVSTNILVNSVEGYSDAMAFLKALPQSNFDILIVDILMPGIRGDEVIMACRKMAHLAHVKIMVLSSVIEYSFIKQITDLKIAAYVSKIAGSDELNDALEFITDPANEGNVFFSSDVKQALAKAEGINGYNVVKLTPREHDIVLAICEGCTVKEISVRLKISAGTIQGYMKLIFRKMDVNRSADLILKAIRYGMYDPHS